MSHKVTAIAGAVAAVGAMLMASPSAHAGPLCEHRSAAHSAQHGGQRVDSDWHVAHGDLPTCDGDDKSNDSSKPSDEVDDDGPILHRDHAGFHCTWHGCG